MKKSPKKTPFYDLHLSHGGKIVEFAGFLLPIQYQSIIEEHRRVRTTVGLFDVSHMGRIEVSGNNALHFVNRVTTNDVSKLGLNQVQYTTFCNSAGGIIDDLLVYRFYESYLLVVNAANAAKDYQWLVDNLDEAVQIVDRTGELAQLALQGPYAEPVLQELTDLSLTDIKYYWGALGRIKGIEAKISRTGYTGEDGFELYFGAAYAEEIWNALLKAGEKYQIAPVALGARDSLRLEMGYCLYGNDINEETSPLEAGLGWITKLDKGDFIGREALIRQKQSGIPRKLIGFELEGQAFPRSHYKILKNGQQIGEVTSGIFSPSLKKGIGMGYVKTLEAKVGNEVEIEIRGRFEKARIVERPFYKKGTHK